VVPGFHCSFLPGIAALSDPGESDINIQNFDADIALRRMTPARHSRQSRNPFRAGGSIFVASLVRLRYGLPGCLPPLYGSDRIASLRGLLLPGFQRIGPPSPLLDITTTATGLLCWRDSHPLEWQLASLHGHSRPNWAGPGHVRFTPGRDRWGGHPGSAASCQLRNSRTAKMGGLRTLQLGNLHTYLGGYHHALSRASQGTELGFAGGPVDLPIAQGQSPEIR